MVLPEFGFLLKLEAWSNPDLVSFLTRMSREIFTMSGAYFMGNIQLVNLREFIE